MSSYVEGGGAEFSCKTIFSDLSQMVQAAETLGIQAIISYVISTEIDMY